MALETRGAGYQWIGENEPTPASDMAFGDGITLEPMKRGTIVCLTRELVETSGAERAMADALIGWRRLQITSFWIRSMRRRTES